MQKQITKKEFRKVILKYGKEIKIDTFDCKGTIKVIKYREYSGFSEFDIEFKGKIWAKCGKEKKYFIAKELERASTHSKNKFFRRHLDYTFKNSFTIYFGILHFELKKINWI